VFSLRFQHKARALVTGFVLIDDAAWQCELGSAGGDGAPERFTIAAALLDGCAVIVAPNETVSRSAIMPR
jgi:hypothetical protein